MKDEEWQENPFADPLTSMHSISGIQNKSGTQSKPAARTASSYGSVSSANQVTGEGTSSSRVSILIRVHLSTWHLFVYMHMYIYIIDAVRKPTPYG